METKRQFLKRNLGKVRAYLLKIEKSLNEGNIAYAKKRTLQTRSKLENIINKIGGWEENA